MRQRIITGLLLVFGAVLAITLLPSHWFAGLVGVVVAIAAYEWQRLCRLEGLASGLYVVATLFVGGVLFYFLFPTGLVIVAAGALLLWLVLWVDLLRFRSHAAPPRSDTLRLLLGVLVLPLMWYAIVRVHASDAGPWLLIYGMLLVWVADSFAYFAGRAFGRHKLAPAISPGKTLEGVAGGLVGVTVVSAVGALLPIFAMVSSLQLAFWSVLVALVSVGGDLEESRLKREVGAKDSGKLLPGHGGVLDRIDGQIAAMPVWLLALWQMGLLG
ncbi:MAG TPA: phosphatidate cytidylyltransferase [Halothiobacillus sp.]|nr:phosphatidate cytidylyltransferase [Halothiobacillus sp.]